jgi:hypothetical protein
MMTAPRLTQGDKLQAELDFAEFFRRHPNSKNPSDLNTEVKFGYAACIGFQRHRTMEACRKQGVGFAKNVKVATAAAE